MMENRMIMAIAALFGALGVGFGAFGAHALKDTLEATGTMETWRTAVFYQLVHAVALLAVTARPGVPKAIGWLWIAGIVLFSGSLYGLALGGPGFLGPITPFGGLSFIVGWVWLAVEAGMGKRLGKG